MYTLSTKFEGQSIETHKSYYNFSKLCERNLHTYVGRLRRKQEESKTNFVDAYLSGFKSNMEQEVPTMREFLQQNWLISIQALLSYKCVKMAFSWFL